LNVAWGELNLKLRLL